MADVAGRCDSEEYPRGGAETTKGRPAVTDRPQGRCDASYAPSVPRYNSMTFGSLSSSWPVAVYAEVPWSST